MHSCSCHLQLFDFELAPRTWHTCVNDINWGCTSNEQRDVTVHMHLHACATCTCMCVWSLAAQTTISNGFFQKVKKQSGTRYAFQRSKPGERRRGTLHEYMVHDSLKSSLAFHKPATHAATAAARPGLKASDRSTSMAVKAFQRTGTHITGLVA